MTASSGATTIYTRDFRLGEWLVRPSLNRLERDGEATQIEPKAMDVLVELAEHEGQVRSKNRLIRVVWGEAFVTDDVLTQAIRLLRRALGDDAKEPTYIETIPKRGYRLIAPVTREAGHGEVDSQQIGHYRILEKLGSGGMGVVYKAEDTRLKRTVALKFLPPELADDPERMKRLQREAEALAALDHPGIVTIHAIEREGDQRFLVMQHVQGSTLADRLPERGFDRRKLFDIAIRLADALSEAHEKGVVHRDLKPANVMIDTRGRPRILDFGLAKREPPQRPDEPGALPSEPMTVDGKVLGTYPYMSPEQVEGRPADHRSDIFSLGAVLYEMATGRAPFTGDSSASVMSAILRDTPPPVDQQRDDLPHHLARILGRCVEKEPENRYQQARTLRRDLEELRREVEGGRSRELAAAQMTSRHRKPSWRLATILGAMAALLGLGITYLVQTRESKAPAEAPGSAITSLAVLPLKNLSQEPEQDYFADGITDGLIADLSQISALRVISSQSVMRFKGSNKPLPEIARELDVKALVQGSVLHSGDRVRIMTQLVQADPETHLWSRTYERDTTDLFKLLGEVTREIAEEIQIAVAPDERSRLAANRDVKPEALEAYLRGVTLSKIGTPDAIEKSLVYFQEAVAAEPSFAAAWARLANTYGDLEIWGLPPKANELRAAVAAAFDAALEKTLELDDSLGVAYSLRAAQAITRDWNWQQALEDFERGVELSPNDPRVHGLYGWFLAALDRCDEARRHVRLAERLNPLSPGALGRTGWVLYFCHDFEQALRHYEQAVERYPDHYAVHGFGGFTLISLGREDEAVKIWQRSRAWDGMTDLAESYEGKSLFEVNRLFAAAAEDPSSPLHQPMVIAKVYAENRETEKVFEWLERAFAYMEEPGGHPGWEMPFLAVDPDFQYLHSNPRFQEMLRRINLAD